MATRVDRHMGYYRQYYEGRTYNMAMVKHTGGCHCGKFRFTTDYDTLLVIQCNCNRCRRLMGTLNVFAVFGKEEIEFVGKTT